MRPAMKVASTGDVGLVRVLDGVGPGRGRGSPVISRMWKRGGFTSLSRGNSMERSEGAWVVPVDDPGPPVVFDVVAERQPL